MAPHGFWQYAKLKLVVTLIRILNYMGTRRHLKPSAECRRTAVRIPSRQHRRFIKAWLYFPPDHNNDNITINTTTTKDNTLIEPRGVVINWHGGGYVMSNLGMDHAFCERIARDVRVLVLDADYRKGPEHPYPSAVEDAEDVMRWVAGRPRVFDADRVAVSGFSSGGNLALVAASASSPPALRVRSVCAFYPGVDFTVPPEDKVVAEPIAPLPVFAQHLFADSYVPRPEDRAAPRASPAFAPAADFPAQVLLVVCSGDVLAPEAEALGRRLREARGGSGGGGGGDGGVQTVMVQGAAHGFDKTVKPDFHDEEKTEMAYATVVKSLRAVMSKDG